MSPRWKGIVFDLDGTLIDTEKLYRRFWVEAARQMGYPMEERHALMIRAMAASVAGPLLRREVCPEFDYEGVRALRRKLMEEYVDVHGVQAMPGMIPLLDAVRARGMRIALATATQEARARKYLRMVQAETYFDAVVTADQVPCGKPAPDIYALAVKRLGLAPQEAMAVEDAPSGVRSAHDAGLFTVMVPEHTQPDDSTRALCNAVVPSLLDVVPLL